MHGAPLKKVNRYTVRKIGEELGVVTYIDEPIMNNILLRSFLRARIALKLTRWLAQDTHCQQREKRKFELLQHEPHQAASLPPKKRPTPATLLFSPPRGGKRTARISMKPVWRRSQRLAAMGGPSSALPKEIVFIELSSDTKPEVKLEDAIDEVVDPEKDPEEEKEEEAEDRIWQEAEFAYYFELADLSPSNSFARSCA
ncbi:hypothetical protein PIB30_006112 [Stylosanthes scabra]|uniref:Uncharacterized protein n=1 Tax=Stylosanthes scabra TaxID=79078 RepID=A0ABU6W4E6_9FABA|nr:hypothetical protein [Stylosanthes scabra]